MTVASAMASGRAKLRYFARIEGIKHQFWAGSDLVPGGHPVQDRTLLAHWELDEVAATANAVDSTGNGHTGTANNSPTVQDGKIEGARGFGASAQRFSVAHATRLKPQRLTVGAWVYFDSTTQPANGKAVYQHHLSKGQSWAIRTSAAGGSSYGVAVSFTDGSTAYAYGSPLSVGWHHLALTWDGTILSYYADGVLAGSAGSTAKTLDYDNANLGIGCDLVTAGQWIDGRLDDVAIYGECKSAAWVRQVYRNGAFSRPGLGVLEIPGGEASTGLDFRAMKASLSRLELELTDIRDPFRRDTDDVWLFARMFAPGRPTSSAVKRTTLRRLASGDVQLDADATTVYVKSVTGWDTSGVGHIGKEAFSYTGATTDTTTGFVSAETIGKFTGVTKGLWPALRDTNRGRTYPYPLVGDEIEGDLGEMFEVTSEPATLIGREVGLYATAWDDANGQWETSPTLVWAGQIAGHPEHGRDGVWRLVCESVDAMLERDVGTHYPVCTLAGGINLNGNLGRRFVIRISAASGSGGFIDEAEVTVAAGWYSPAELQAEIATKIVAATWTRIHGTGTAAKPFVKWLPDGAFYCNSTVSGTDDWRTCTIETQIRDSAGVINELSHAWQALGFELGDIRFKLLEDGSGSWIGSIAPDAEAFADYHPLEEIYNGGECRTQQHANDALWTDQGDGWAWVMAEDQYIRGLDKPTGTACIAYDGYASDGLFVDLDVDVINAITIEHADGGNRDPAGFVGRPVGDSPLELTQVYIPNSARGPLESLLHLLASSGTAGYNDSTYDTAPLAMSVDVPIEIIDWESIYMQDAAIRNTFGELARRPFYLIDETTPWIELWQREAQLFGVFLTWDAQRGKLVCRNARSLTSQPSVASVSPRPTDEARLTISDETVVNQWVIECTHERRDNKGKVELDYRDAASQQALGRVEKVEIKHPGIIPPDGDAAGYIAQFVQPLFLSRATLQRYARAATTITIPASKQHQIAAGDIVTYTASNQFPDPSGSGKLTAAVKALVTNSRWNYRRCEGILDIILYDAAADDVAPWGYAAIVDRSATSGGWDNTTKQLTLVAQIYSNGTNDDGAAIEEGHYVYVQESAPEDPTSITRWGPFEVDSDYETDGAQILTLVAGTTMAGFDTAGATEYVVVPADWDDASAAQQLAGTWQADATDEDLGSGSDDPQRWG